MDHNSNNKRRNRSNNDDQNEIIHRKIMIEKSILFHSEKASATSLRLKIYKNSILM